MARSDMAMAAIFAMWVMMVGAASAAATTNCDSSTTSLLPCYSYVTGPDAKPPAECCGGLSTLSTSSPTCLCQLITQLKGSAASQPSVNITKALSLPQDCTITLKTGDCPALAGLPVTPSTGAPTTSSPVPTAAAGPAASPVPGNDVARIFPTSWMVVGAAAAVGVLQNLW